MNPQKIMASKWETLLNALCEDGKKEYKNAILFCSITTQIQIFYLITRLLMKKIQSCISEAYSCFACISKTYYLFACISKVYSLFACISEAYSRFACISEAYSRFACISEAYSRFAYISKAYSRLGLTLKEHDKLKGLEFIGIIWDL
jgi:hypothetical protein